MAVYNDVEGWQNKQFLGRGEFTLPFGDYKVNITVPSDHIVGSTGELQNPGSVLTSTQQERFKKAKTAKEPVVIVTQEEAEAAEKKTNQPQLKPGHILRQMSEILLLQLLENLFGMQWELN